MYSKCENEIKFNYLNDSDISTIILKNDVNGSNRNKYIQIIIYFKNF